MSSRSQLQTIAKISLSLCMIALAIFIVGGPPWRLSFPRFFSFLATLILGIFLFFKFLKLDVKSDRLKICVHIIVFGTFIGPFLTPYFFIGPLFLPRVAFFTSFISSATLAILVMYRYKSLNSESGKDAFSSHGAFGLFGGAMCGLFGIWVAYIVDAILQNRGIGALFMLGTKPNKIDGFYSLNFIIMMSVFAGAVSGGIAVPWAFKRYSSSQVPTLATKG